MDSINKRIAERFQPTLDCSICGYLADDKELDRFITIQKMIDKGVSKDDIERLKKYL